MVAGIPPSFMELNPNTCTCSCKIMLAAESHQASNVIPKPNVPVTMHQYQHPATEANILNVSHYQYLYIYTIPIPDSMDHG